MTSASLRRTVCVVIAIAVAAAALSAPVATFVRQTIVKDSGPPSGIVGVGPEALFAPGVVAGPSPSRHLASHTLRRSILTVSEKALRAGVIVETEAHLLNLFPDVKIAALRSRVESRSSRTYTWFGYVPGDAFGRVIISVLDGRLSAFITHAHKHYLVLPIDGDGRLEALEIQPESFAEGNDTSPAIEVKGSDDTRDNTRRPTQLGTFIDVDGLIRAFGPSVAVSTVNVNGYVSMVPDDGTVIDIIVAYSAAAASEADPSYPNAPPWSLLGLIDLSIHAANESFEQSGINTRLNLVRPAFEALQFQESGSMETDLSDAIAGTSALAGLHLVRNAWAADLVVLVTTGGSELGDGGPACGRGRVKMAASDPLVTAVNGYAIVRWECLAAGYTLAHEAGHLLGAAHDWYHHKLHDFDLDVDRWSHGYVVLTPAGGERTIMAYSTECTEKMQTCPLIGRWSDPDAMGNYGPLGLPRDGFEKEPAHDVKTLNDNRRDVARYRASVCRLLFSC